MNNYKFVLVGHGSIGSRFKDALIKLKIDKKDIYIIEKNKELLSNLKAQNYVCFDDIEEIPKSDGYELAGIIANWGPDHLPSANKLVDKGCKKLIIEKPISHSIAELIKFKERCKSNNLFVTVHYFWKYTNIISKIRKIEEELCLDQPHGFRIIGGAVCLSTNGTHYFDLGCELLESNPVSVVSDLEVDYINPRDQSLAYIGGSASYKMTNSKFIHLSFSNKNSQAIRAELLYRDGIIEIGYEEGLICSMRDKESINKYGDKITRYGEFSSKKLYNFKNSNTVENILNNLIFDSNPRVPLEEAEVSLRMVIGALQSHEENRRIDLNEVKDFGYRIS